jgi:hypothetical protein
MKIKTLYDVGDKVKYIAGNWHKKIEYSKGKILGISITVNGNTITVNYHIEDRGGWKYMNVQRVESKIVKKLS